MGTVVSMADVMNISPLARRLKDHAQLHQRVQVRTSPPCWFCGSLWPLPCWFCWSNVPDPHSGEEGSIDWVEWDMSRGETRYYVLFEDGTCEDYHRRNLVFPD